MTTRNPYRNLPSVARVLADERVRALSAQYSGDTVVALVRGALEASRPRGRQARGRPRPRRGGGGGAPPLDALAAAGGRRARSALAPSLRPVVNATGVIIHTNLGRAPLSDEALAAMNAVARGYSNLEFDLEAGERGSRHVHLEEQLRRLTGAEAALVVNNNASAVLLALSALPPEPTPQESLAAGADLVLFSGDKLLGGPQAGIIAGRRELVERLRRHPLARALRLDKASIAGLAATLDHYLRDEALEQIPVWRMIATPVDA